MMEVSFGIICACIPPLRPAMRLLIRNLRSCLGIVEPPKPARSPMPTSSNDFSPEPKRGGGRLENGVLEMGIFERRNLGSTSNLSSPAPCYSPHGSSVQSFSPQSSTYVPSSLSRASSGQSSADNSSRDPFSSRQDSDAPSMRHTVTDSEGSVRDAGLWDWI